ncbi:MAG: hypothetical protein GY696_39905 [Gammaproteobacteria bacterium]|nr:hypothetical protein [Gammaproteobacteria bacterium]
MCCASQLSAWERRAIKSCAQKELVLLASVFSKGTMQLFIGPYRFHDRTFVEVVAIISIQVLCELRPTRSFVMLADVETVMR